MIGEITPKLVLEELAEMAFAEIGGDVKIADKLKALDMLYKYLHMDDGGGEDGVVIMDDVEENGKKGE